MYRAFRELSLDGFVIHCISLKLLQSRWFYKRVKSFFWKAIFFERALRTYYDIFSLIFFPPWDTAKPNYRRKITMSVIEHEGASHLQKHRSCGWRGKVTLSSAEECDSNILECKTHLLVLRETCAESGRWRGRAVGLFLISGLSHRSRSG